MTKPKKGIKKKKDYSKLIFFFVVLIVLAGFVGVINLEKTKKQNELTNTYNGFDFIFDPTNNYWIVQIQTAGEPFWFPFHNHPEELGDIIIEENIDDLIVYNRPEFIVISIPPNSSSEMALAGIEISKITDEGQILNIPTSSALNEEVEGMPFAPCEQANEKVVIVSFEKSDKNEIRSEGYCIILEYEEGDETKVADLFAYHLLKIM